MTNGPSDTGAIERELDDTRTRLDATIGALQQKLAPGSMVDQAVDYFKEGGGVEFGRNLGRSMRDNPIPVALIGVGIGWLIFSNASRQGAADDRDWEERRWPRAEPAAGGYDADRYGSGLGSDRYGRGNRAYGGYGQDVSRHQPMPYEAAAYDDLAGKAHRAAGEVQRNPGEEDDSFQGRVEAARATVLGLTRNAGEALEGFRARIEEALSSAASSARSLASGVAGSGSRLGDHVGDAAGQVRDFSSRTVDYVQEQPLLLGALGISIGAAIGLLLPASNYERRVAASLRDSLGESARQVAGEAGHRVARVAETVIDTAQEASRREGFVDPEGRDLASSARERVADVAGRARHVVEETAAAGRDAVRRELAGEGDEAGAKAGGGSAGGAGTLNTPTSTQANNQPGSRGSGEHISRG